MRFVKGNKNKEKNKAIVKGIITKCIWLNKFQDYLNMDIYGYPWKRKKEEYLMVGVAFMGMDKKRKKREEKELIKKIVIERLKELPDNVRVSIG